MQIVISSWYLASNPSGFREVVSGDDRDNLSLHALLNRRYGQLLQLAPWIERHPDRFVIAPDVANVISPGATSIPPIAQISESLRVLLAHIEYDQQGQVVSIQRLTRGWLARRTVRWTYFANRRPQHRWRIARAIRLQRPNAAADANRNTININSEPAQARITQGVAGVHYHPIPAQSQHNLHPASHPTLPAVQWTLDSGAGAHVMKDPVGLTDVTILHCPVLVKGVIDSVTMSVTTEAHLDNVTVLFDQRFSTNCLAYSGLVDAGWTIAYAPATDAYQVTSHSGVKLCFQRYKLRSGNITTHYVCHPQLPYVDPFDSDNWYA